MIQIPWEKFREEKIQHLIAMLFLTMGYQIENLHQSDRANEKGADIIVKKSKDKIAIAVKIKPRHKDRSQLMELADRKEKRKIYVYTQTPTKNFKDFMKKYEKIEFWDVKKLNEFFIRKNLYFSSFIIFDNHPINEKLIQIKEFLFLLWDLSKNQKKKRVKQMDKDSLFLLWRLKDAAVVLNQTNNLIARLFDTPFYFKNKKIDEHFIKIFLSYLDILEIKLSSFLDYFIQFFERNKKLVLNSIIEHSTRSHWFWIASYKPLNDISTLKRELKEVIESEKALSKLNKMKNKLSRKEKKEIEDYEKEIKRNNNVWKVMQSKLKSLHMFGEGVEYIIDDIFRENFKEPNRLDISRDLDENIFG